MKIIHLIWAFPIGGSETMLVDIINHQRKKSKITLIIVNSLVDNNLIEQLHSDINIIKINRPPKSYNILYFIKVWFKVFISKVDVIHCHNESLCKLIVGFNYKSCLTVHDVNLNFKYFKKFKKLFAISSSVKEFIFNQTGLESILVYNGIDFKNIKIKNKISYKTFKIVQISRLEHDKKGQDVLIKALRYLVFDLKIKNIKLDFIGSGSSLDYLKELVILCSLEKFVDFRGALNKPTINNTIHNYNLLVQPSIWEGFGLTVVEGMAAKVPVLVSNIDGPIEIIQNGLYGSYFISKDFKDCALKIKSIIKNYDFYSNQDRLDMIREYSYSNFNISNTSENYLKHYRKIEQ